MTLVPRPWLGNMLGIGCSHRDEGAFEERHANACCQEAFGDLSGNVEAKCKCIQLPGLLFTLHGTDLLYADL